MVTVGEWCHSATQERSMRIFNLKNKTKLVRQIICIFLISVLYLTISFADERPCEWAGVKKIIAIGDLHGDYHHFIEILKGVQLVDDDLHWKGGELHFVQTGDILDRGPDAKKIFDLIRKMEKEAEDAGGMVHMLIGNHEEMNITSIALNYPGYVTVEQFLSFLPEKFRKNKEEAFQKEFNKKSINSTNPDMSYEAELYKYWDDLSKKNKEAQQEYVQNFNDEYGKWIIEHNAVIKINDTVFAHGGISRQYSKEKLEDINKQLRYELEAFRIALKRSQNIRFKPRIVYDQNGPLWYRGLAENKNDGFQNEIDHILKNLGANKMVIAHTPQMGSKIASEEYMTRYDRKIWIIDTGISDAYGGFLSALIIEDGNFQIWPPGGENDNN
jgi:predicted MPP superfamily phosphohydrolase